MAAAQAKDTTADQLEWAQFVEHLTMMLRALGLLLFLPLILIAVCAVGFRAGIIAGAREALRMLERWC